MGRTDARRPGGHLDRRSRWPARCSSATTCPQAIEAGRRLIGRQPERALRRRPRAREPRHVPDPARGSGRSAWPCSRAWASTPRPPSSKLYGRAVRALALAMAGDAPGGEAVSGAGGRAGARLGSHAARWPAAPWRSRGEWPSLARVDPGRRSLSWRPRSSTGVPRLARSRARTRCCAWPRSSRPTAMSSVHAAWPARRGGSSLACRDVGALTALLDQVERGLNIRLRRAMAKGEMPTEAEIRVLRLLAGPLPVRAIAAELTLSPNTVKTHVKAINRRLGTTSRAEAVARARELGLI